MNAAGARKAETHVRPPTDHIATFPIKGSVLMPQLPAFLSLQDSILWSSLK